MEKAAEMNGNRTTLSRKVFRGVIVTVILVALLPILVMWLASSRVLIDANNPFLLMGMNKFDVLGNSAENIAAKYRLDTVEYGDDGSVLVQYYFCTEKCHSAYSAIDADEDIDNVRIRVTFENGIAVRMDTVQSTVAGDFFERQSPFDDWFTG